MKIAKCKCGGQAILTGKNKNIPQCSICKRFAMSVDYWNTANTDQYGQQLTEQNITWVEWDGDVEHLPKREGTPILVKFLKYNAINSGVLKFDFSDDEVLIGARIIYPESGGYDPIEKGDQFAVVGEDSHAS